MSVFNVIARIYESKILTKHKSRECKCKFDGRKCNSDQKWNNYKCRCECKNLKEDNACEQDYIWNASTCICKNGEYLGISLDNSVITCDKIVNGVSTNVTNTISTNVMSIVSIIFDDKNLRYKKDCYCTQF